METATEPTSPAVYLPTSTPILDVLRPLPKGERWKLSAGEIFFLSSVFIFSLIIVQAIGPLAVDVAKPAVLVDVLIAGVGLFALAVLVHEVGHLFSAWLAGFRIARANDSELKSLGHLRGSEVAVFRFVGLRPVKMQNLPRRLFLISAGGPVASLMVPLILENLSLARPAWLANCVHFLALSSALLGISALLPDLNRAGKFSDGARLVMLLKNDARAQRWISILRIQCAWADGKAPQTWPQSWVDKITASDDSSRDAIHGNWLAYLWATDREDVTRATLYLETALGFSAPVLRPLFQKIVLEAAIFQAWFRENRTQADFWAARLNRKKLSCWQRQRLEVALLWAEGQLFDAQEKLTSYLAELAESPESPARDSAESDAGEWKRQMESRMLTRAWRNIYSMSQQVESAADALPVSR